MTMMGKYMFMGVGAIWGWFVAEFHPAFPLAVVMVIFCLYDAYTAYRQKIDEVKDIISTQISENAQKRIVEGYM